MNVNHYYQLVEFIDENRVAVVSTVWIFIQENQERCWWPDLYKTEKSPDRCLVTHTLPNSNKGWGKYLI